MTIRGRVTGRHLPSRPNRPGEEVGWIDLAATCTRCGDERRLTIDERTTDVLPEGYCGLCWHKGLGRRSGTLHWRVVRVVEDCHVG